MHILMSLLITLFVVQPAFAEWDYGKHSIEVDQILSGGPPKDGIPALLDPQFSSGRKATFMRGDEQILGVEINGIARAYPVRILSWHELVNDKFGDSAVLVSW